MLETISHITAIAAGLVTILGAAYALFRYHASRRLWTLKVTEVETYLATKAATSDPGTRGLHTVTHLMRHTGLPEADILRICFESPVIGRRVSTDKAGKAKVLLFHHITASLE